MLQKEKLLHLANQNNGVLFTKIATDLGYHRATIQDLVDDGKLIPVQRGIYVTENGYVDDFFLLGSKFRNGIFSHETALYLLGFSDRAPIRITMTFLHGTSSTRIKNNGVKPIMVTKDHTLGESSIQKNGLPLRVYEIERTLIDLLKPRYDTDMEQLIPAIKKYATYEKKDINKLFRYGRYFGLEEKIRNYMGVLL